MKHYFMLISMALLTSCTGVTVMTTHKLDSDIIDNLGFTTQCLGRYAIDIPANMEPIYAKYSNPIYVFRHVWNHTGEGIQQGDNRVQLWRDYVKQQKEKDNTRLGPSKFVLENVDSDVKVKSYYKDVRQLANDPNAKHQFWSYFFKDNPQEAMGITLEASKPLKVKRDATNIEQQLYAYNQKVIDASQWVMVSKDYPQQKAGICFPFDLSVAYPTPPQDKKGYYERYTTFFKVKPITTTGSFFEIETETYSDVESLEEDLNMTSGLFSKIASTSMTIAGRKGRLFVTGDPYSANIKEFFWRATDSKINSIQYTGLTITGRVNLDEDYPELVSYVSSTEMLVALLRSIRVRDNAMKGVVR